jgi:hypothetical protein
MFQYTFPRLFAEGYDEEVEDIRGLARAIHGHPMTYRASAQVEGVLHFANLGLWCVLPWQRPSLERIIFGLREPEYEEECRSARTSSLQAEDACSAILSGFDGFYFANGFVMQ